MKPFKKLTAYTDETPVVASTGSVMNQPATVEEAARAYAEGKSSSSVFQEAHIADFLAGYNYAQQPEPSPALDETRDSLSELIRSMSQIENGTTGLSELASKRLAKAKEVLAKYADPNQPRIVQSVKPEPMGGKTADYWKGFEAALDLLESLGYTKNAGHPYNIKDCTLAKVNRLTNSEIRRTEYSQPQWRETEKDWISVEDEIPNTGRDVILADIKRGIVTTGFMSFHPKGFVPNCTMTITHWKELPQPPTTK